MERVWNYYEDGLPALIADLAACRTFGADPFGYRDRILRYLIPYLAGVTIRGQDWEEWHERAIAQAVEEGWPIGGPSPLMHASATHSRQKHFVQMASRIMRSSWHLDFAPLDTRFITNDLGYATMALRYPPGKGAIFPLSPRMAVVLRRSPTIGQGHRRIAPEMVQRANEMLAAQAWDAIYGQALDDVQNLPLDQDRLVHRQTARDVLTLDAPEHGLDWQWHQALRESGQPLPDGYEFFPPPPGTPFNSIIGIPGP